MSILAEMLHRNRCVFGIQKKNHPTNDIIIRSFAKNKQNMIMRKLGGYNELTILGSE